MKDKRIVIELIVMLIAFAALIISFVQTNIAQDQTDIAIFQTSIANDTLNLYKIDVNTNLKFLKEQSELINKQLELLNHQLEPQIIFQVIPYPSINRYSDNFTVRSNDINNDFSIDAIIYNVGEKSVQIWDLAVTDNCFNEISGSHGWLGFEGDILYSNKDITYTFNSSKLYVKKYLNTIHSTNKSCVMTFRLGTSNGYYFREIKIDKS